MKAKMEHGWRMGTGEARKLQLELAGEVRRQSEYGSIATVCGVDIGIRGGMARAACVVMSFPDLEILEERAEESRVSFPYVPGLLSFREIPPLVPLLERLAVEPDLVLADGQGIAHPRRFGLACHLGLLFDVPCIGCAKSVLVGVYREPGASAGDHEYLYDGSEVIGAALRTRASVKPVFVSTGHRVSLEDAIRLTLSCCRGYRLPEPLRRAHVAASGPDAA